MSELPHTFENQHVGADKPEANERRGFEAPGVDVRNPELRLIEDHEEDTDHPDGVEDVKQIRERIRQINRARESGGVDLKLDHVETENTQTDIIKPNDASSAFMKVKKVARSKFEDLRLMLRMGLNISRGIEMEVGTNDAISKKARKLHAQRYLEIDYIDKDALNAEGFINEHIDPYHEFSTYFTASNGDGEVLGASRLIHSGHNDGFRSFQMYEHATLTEEGDQFINSHNPSNTVEVSALVKRAKAEKIVPVELYRAMWQHSMREGHELWLFTLDNNIYPWFENFFRGAIQIVGEKTELSEYKAEVVPCAMSPQSIAEKLISHAYNSKGKERLFMRTFVKYFTNGLEDEYLTEKQLTQLESLNLR